MTKILRAFLHRSKVLLLMAVMLMCIVQAKSFGYAGDYTMQVKVVKCYPNPATSFVNFEFPNNIDKSYMLQVYSFTGRKMTEMQVSSSKISLTLTNEYFRGIYIFQLRDKNGRIIETGKFQVAR